MIKAGDLVMVVNAAQCGCTHLIGLVFNVDGFTRRDFFRCVKCKSTWSQRNGAVKGYLDFEFDPRRLKKIDPPATGEYDRVPQKLKEPA